MIEIIDNKNNNNFTTLGEARANSLLVVEGGNGIDCKIAEGTVIYRFGVIFLDFTNQYYNHIDDYLDLKVRYLNEPVIVKYSNE